MKINLSCCEYFENQIEDKCLEKLGINKNEIQNPNNGVTANILNDAGAVTSIMLGLGVGVTLALSIGSFGIGSIVGATVAGVTFTVTKIDKKMKKSTAEKLDKKVQIYFHSHLRCIIMDTAKELSRMFEYQVLTLKDGSQIDVLAECAVDLMLNLKRNDKFDRNTLLKKVLQDGKIGKKELLTTNDDKWFAPDVFRKPGLQRTAVETHRAVFTYQVKPDHSCDPINYGYRGQFLEMREYGSQKKGNIKVRRYRKAPATNKTVTCEDPCKELCEECSSNFESCPSGEYFVESDIDLKYTKPQKVLLKYHPIHILVQCPKILQSFKQTQENKPSFAEFLKKKFMLPEDHLVHPVYRQHSPGNVPDLTNSDLSGSDFSHSNFTNSCLENCDFTKCVMLLAQLPGAKISSSKFCETLISHSNLAAVQADKCIWTKTSLLSSRVDGAHLDDSIGGNCLYETNMSDAIIGKRELNRNESK